MGSPLEEKMEETKMLFRTYIHQQIEVIKLEALEKGSVFAGKMVSNVLMAFFSVLLILFLSIAAAVGIGDAIDSTFYGFLIVAGFFLLLILILLFFKKHIIHNPITNMIIKKAMEKDGK